MDRLSYKQAGWGETVRCPGHQKATPCHFQGTVRSVLAHIIADLKAEKRCSTLVQINSQNSYNGFMADRVRPAKSVFTEEKNTLACHPMIFLSEQHLNQAVYMLVQRAPVGIWTFQFRTLTKVNQRGYAINVELKLFGRDDNKYPMFRYEGFVNSWRPTTREVLKSGNHFSLTDHQVQALSFDNKLFNFEVKIRAPRIGSEEEKAKERRALPPKKRRIEFQ